MTPPTPTIEEQLDEILAEYGSQRAFAYRDIGDNPPYSDVAEKLKSEAKAAVSLLITKARIDENESLLDVAEHEMALPDHCEMHDKYTSACHACKKRKWYGEISKDWKRVIDIRINELKATTQKPTND